MAANYRVACLLTPLSSLHIWILPTRIMVLWLVRRPHLYIYTTNDLVVAFAYLEDHRLSARLYNGC